MYVFGTHQDSWIPVMRGALISLMDKASRQVGDIQPNSLEPDELKLDLLNGEFLIIRVNEDAIEVTLKDSDGEDHVHIRDETIAIDAEAREMLNINNQWAEAIIGRWVEIIADYRNIDVASEKTALLQSFEPSDLEKILGVYKHMTEHYSRSSHSRKLLLHLTLPTPYWSGNAFAIDEAMKQFFIAEDPGFTDKLENLPEACEILTLEGQGVRLEIVPLYLKPVQIN